MEEAIQKFIKYLHKTRKASVNTEMSYRRDLEKLYRFLNGELGITAWENVTATNLNTYMLYMEEQKYASSSISRSTSSLASSLAWASMASRSLSLRADSRLVA